MAMKVAVVVGASRGVGLAVAKDLHTKGYEVFATCRKECDALSDLESQSSSFHTISERRAILSQKIVMSTGVDVASAEGCGSLSTLPKDQVHLLVHSAGVQARDEISTMDLSDASWQYNINALGPVRSVQALLPKLTQGSRIVVIGSKMGSFGELGPGPLVGYRMSKCAAHMAVRCLAEDLKPRGIAVAVVHPGVVSTDMLKISRSTPQVEPAESAAGIAAVAEALDMDSTGRFCNFKGEAMAW